MACVCGSKRPGTPSMVQGPASSVPLESWMSMLSPALRVRSVCELALPGAHNSGAHAVLAVPEEFLARKVGTRAARWSFVPAVVAPFAGISAVCQELPISGLLKRGVRALDFRLGMYNGQVYVCHTVVCTVMWRQALAEIAQFLHESPDEVVVFMVRRDWEHQTFDSAETWDMVQRDMEEILGDLLANDPKALSKSLDKLCSAGERAIPLMQVPPVARQWVGLPMTASNLQKSWKSETKTADAMADVIAEWRDTGLTKPEPGVLKFLEIALPGRPACLAPAATAKFRDFLAAGPLHIGAMLDFPDEETIREMLANNFPDSAEAQDLDRSRSISSTES